MKLTFTRDINVRTISKSCISVMKLNASTGNFKTAVNGIVRNTQLQNAPTGNKEDINSEAAIAPVYEEDDTDSLFIAMKPINNAYIVIPVKTNQICLYV